MIRPGGGGGADFHAFCKRIYEHALPENFVAVQPVAVPWTEAQRIVWPTAKSKVKKMTFTTETFVDDVIADASRCHRIDPRRIFVLGWSSSGPAADAISLTGRSKPTGYFIAMSVFKSDSLPKFSAAKGKAYHLYHSPEDRVCPHRMAKDAETQLRKNGAKVAFKDYAGGTAGAGRCTRHPRGDCVARRERTQVVVAHASTRPRGPRRAQSHAA